MKKTIIVTYVSTIALCLFGSATNDVATSLIDKLRKAAPEERDVLIRQMQADGRKRIEEQRSRLPELAKALPLSVQTESTSWVRGQSTNDVTVTVYVGGVRNGLFAVPVFRMLTFDKDGRLKSVSNAVCGNSKTGSHISDNPSNVGK